MTLAFMTTGASEPHRGKLAFVRLAGDDGATDDAYSPSSRKASLTLAPTTTGASEPHRGKLAVVRLVRDDGATNDA